METTPTIIESQVDWCTVSGHTAELREQLREWAETTAVQYEALTNTQRYFHTGPFRGWLQGRVRFGERGNAGLVQVSGELAGDHWRELLPLGDHLGRIDVEVTARFEERNHTIGPHAYTLAEEAYRTRPRYPRPEHHGDADSGWTTQLGRRGSPWVLRLYDKQAEREGAHHRKGAEHYTNCWRWEIEAKADAANRVAHTLLTVADEPQTVRALVRDYLQEHGLAVPFPAQGHITLVRGMTRRADTESTLRWLGETVRPGLQRVIQAGALGDALVNLGLDIQTDWTWDGVEFPP